MMKIRRALFVLLMWAGFALAAFGQSTTVSGTVTDVSSQTWNNGTFAFQFVPNPQYPASTYTWTGGAFNQNAQITGSLNGSGAYSVSIPSNANISPINSQWKVTFCPQATATCYTTTGVTIFGATQTLNATPPSITVTAQSNVLPIAYADTEITGAIAGSAYYNVTLASVRVCSAIPCSSNWTSSGGGTPAAQIAPNTGIFTVSNNCSGQSNCLAWTDDNSTDNCGTATTTFMTAINAYAGPGRPQVFIGGSGVGKAYKLTSCSLAFLIPVNITMSATINCAQSSANCIQFGPTGQSGFTAANSPTYGIHGGGTFVGGASLTLAGIECEPWMSDCEIDNIKWINFGATNATAGVCTNYAIYYDTNVAEGIVSHNEWVATDATPRRCAFANPNGASTGENTVFFFDNIMGGAGTGALCGSVAIVDGGSYGDSRGNNIYAFAADTRVQGIGHRIEHNQFDTAGCTLGGVNAAVQVGATSSATTVGPILMEGNIAQFGSGHTTYLMAQAGDSTATLTGVSSIGNQAALVGSLTTGQFMPATSCINNSTVGTVCYEYGNMQMTVLTPCGATSAGWQNGNILSSCVSSAQTANLAATTAITPSVGEGMNVSCQVILTTAATTSSTLPQCVITYTDSFTNTTQTLTLTPVWAAATAGCSGSVTDTVGNSCQGSTGIIAPKVNTAVQYSTINYASVGGTAMAYQVFVRAVTQ